MVSRISLMIGSPIFVIKRECIGYVTYDTMEEIDGNLFDACDLNFKEILEDCINHLSLMMGKRGKLQKQSNTIFCLRKCINLKHKPKEH